MTERRQQGGSFNLIVGIAMLLVSIMVLWFLFKSIFSILAFIAPILLIITFILNKNVVLDYVKGMMSRLKNDTVMGLAQLGGTFFFFPVVSAYLFGKALLIRKVGKIKNELNKEKEGEFAEYEDITEDEVLDLKDLDEVVQKETPRATNNNKYDDLFNE